MISVLWIITAYYYRVKDNILSLMVLLKKHVVRDTRLLADGIVKVCTMRREHFAIYASLGKVNF